MILALAIAAGSLAVAIRSGGAAVTAGRASDSSVPASGIWHPFSVAALDELRDAGTPVFIDFSAAWCLSCKVNERIALADPAVEARLKELGVAALKADWTDRNDEIARALASFGRSGVPMYVLYGPGSDDPIILPELLTPGIVLDALDRAFGG
jgi:thiol:disulfide interchange protein DsbD